MTFTSTLDNIYLWSDDTICFGYELEEMLGFMSDDYIVVKLDDLLYDDVSVGKLGYDDVVKARRDQELNNGKDVDEAN